MALFLGARLFEYLKKRGAEGALRTHLLQRFRCKASDFDASMQVLLANGEVVAWANPRKSVGGRPSTTYYVKEATKDLTPPAQPATPTRDETVADEPKRSTPCKTCGRAIPMPARGHPYVYCSPLCRGGGYPMQTFLKRAENPLIWAQVAVCLVMADLVMRGFHIARHIFIAGSRILVTDHQGGVAGLDVIPLGLDGTPPDPQDYETMAVVYRDGRICYGGRNSFIDPEPVVDEPTAADVEGEQDGVAVLTASEVVAGEIEDDQAPSLLDYENADPNDGGH